jgi:hypothetical protein
MAEELDRIKFTNEESLAAAAFFALTSLTG